jgi:glyoxylate reductase
MAPEGSRHVDFDTLLEVSDFICVHAPLTQNTFHQFGFDAFKRMKTTAVFVNTGRGEIHDQKALSKALKEGLIFSAGLDVTSPEPIASDDSLLGLPNCIVLPHIGSATVESREAMADIAADNLLLGLQGSPLRCPVTV